MKDAEKGENSSSLEERLRKLELNQSTKQENKENMSAEEIENVENDKENISPRAQLQNEKIPRVQKYQQHRTEASIEKLRESSLSDESILPDDLQKAVEMLSILVSTRKIDNNTKQKLMKKVVKQLLRARSSCSDDTTKETNDSIKTMSSHSTLEREHESIKSISGITALSATKSLIEPLNEQTKDKENHKDFTNSNVNISDEIIEQKTDSGEKIIQGDDDKEQDAVKNWLAPMTYSEIKFMNQKLQSFNLKDTQVKYETQEHSRKANDKCTHINSSLENIRQLYRNEKIEHINWINKEIDRLKQLKMKISESRKERIDCDLNQDQENLYANADKEDTTGSSLSSEWFAKDINSSVYNQNNSPNGYIHLSKWDSHLNMRNVVKNRTKLEIPSTDESLQSYAKAKRDEFMNKYANKIENHYSNNDIIVGKELPQPIYTRPYSSNVGYCESRRDNIKTLSKQTLNVDAFTSITDSNDFLSSNSIPIVFTRDSTSNTTTHQYDNKTNVGVQTSDTLTKTKQILKSKKDVNSPPTIRVVGLTNNKQQQMRPQPLAYAITFIQKKEITSHQERKEITSEKEIDNHIYVDESISSGSVISHQLINAFKRIKESSQQTSKYKGISSSSQDSFESYEQLTLQEHLKKQRPDFFSNAEDRRKCVNELHNLR